MAAPVRPAAATDDLILAAYRRLGSAYAAAAELGVGASTVYRVLRAHGVKATGRQRFTPAEVRALVQAFEAGASVAELAVRHADEPNKVRRALARAGVVIRPERDGRRSGEVGGPRVPARPGEADRAVELRGRGMSQRAIAAALWRSVAFVSKALRRAGG